jgi:signal transduction histidine kinase
MVNWKSKYLLFVLAFFLVQSLTAQEEAHTSFDSIALHPEESRIFWMSELHSNDSTSENLRGLAASFLKLNDYQQAKSLAKKALAKTEFKSNPEICSDLHSIICKSLLATVGYLESYQYSLEFASLAIDHGDSSLIARAKLFQAASLYYLDRKDDCHKVQKEIFDISSSISDSVLASLAARNLTARCSELKQTDSAYHWFRLSLLYEPFKDPHSISMSYALFSTSISVEDNAVRKQALLDTAMLFARQCPDSGVVAFVLTKQADCYLSQNRLEQAMTCATKAVAFNKAKNYIDGITHALAVIVKINELEKNPEKALEGLRYISSIRDTVYSLETAKKMSEFETKFKTAEKERENLLLTKENAEKELAFIKEQELRNLTMVIGVFVLALVILMAGFALYSNKQKQTKQLAVMEQKRLRSAVIAQDDERKRIAKELHDGVSQSLARIKLNLEFQLLQNETKGIFEMHEIEQLTTEVGDLQGEVRAISHAMMPRALAENGLVKAVDSLLETTLRHQEIEYEFKHDLEHALDDFVEIEIYRMLQELIANAVKHSSCKTLKVSLVLNDKNLTLVVEDDGIGLELEHKSEGLGLNNLKARAKSLNGTVYWENSTLGGLRTVFEVDGFESLKETK